MYIKRAVDFKTICIFGWKVVLSMLVLSSAVCFIRLQYGFDHFGIPFLPVATIGTAVAFYVGFKNNSSYDRLWEARKIWGELTNLSRSMCAYVIACTGNRGRDEAAAIVHRQILYVNILRAQLRRRAVWEDTLYASLARPQMHKRTYEEQLAEALQGCSCDQERSDLISSSNAAKQIMNVQMAAIHALKDKNLIDGFECSDLMRMCASMFDQQGKAERIKNFPFPRQYAYFSEVFVFIFVALLPFALVPEFAKLDPAATWLAVPFSMLIAWIFTTMEQVGDTSENPFENGVNDVPMSAICRTIEIDLKEMLGEKPLPSPMVAESHVLM